MFVEEIIFLGVIRRSRSRSASVKPEVSSSAAHRNSSFRHKSLLVHAATRQFCYMHAQKLYIPVSQNRVCVCGSDMETVSVAVGVTCPIAAVGPQTGY